VEHLVGAEGGGSADVLNGDVKGIAGVDDEAAGAGRRGGYGAAGAGDGDEGGYTKGIVGEFADTVVFAVGDVEVVGAVDGEAGGLVEPLGGGGGGVAKGVACVAAQGCEARDGADKAGGSDFADAVICRVGDVLVAESVEDKIGRGEINRREGTEVCIKAG